MDGGAAGRDPGAVARRSAVEAPKDIHLLRTYSGEEAKALAERIGKGLERAFREAGGDGFMPLRRSCFQATGIRRWPT